MIDEEKPTQQFWGVRTLTVPDAVWADLNQRRVALLLVLDKHAPPWLKLTRRSRRRWRGRGGAYVYPPHLIKAGHDSGLFRRMGLDR